MTSTDSVISKMRQRKKETGLTLQDIVDRTEALGESVSLATVKRVFSEGAADHDFRRETTLLPIARALGMSLTGPETPGQEGENVQAAISAIKEAYEARIADLWSTIRLLRRDRTIMLIVVIILLLFVFYLFADGLHGSWGFFRHPAV